MRQIDIHAIAANATFNKFHYLLLFMCTMIIVADGYDLAVIGIALPLIMADMGVSSQQAGLMASAAIFGMMIGAVVIGTIADRIGRRTTMLACLGVLSVGTAAAGFTHEPISFSALRFLAGLAIGGVMPCVVAQLTEFAPRSARATMVTIAFSGFAIGGILAALVGKGLVLSYGWQSIFFAAGLQLLLIPFLFRSMPESMALLARHRRVNELRAIAQRLAPAMALRAEDQFPDAAASDETGGSAISQLFRNGRGVSTAMFWTASFMCLFVTYGLGVWLVKMMAGAGYSLGSALTFVLVLNVGALIGSVSAGRLGDRFPIKWVLFGLYSVASVGILMLSNKMSSVWLYFFVCVVGAALYGGQTLTYAYAGQFYPMTIRGAGVGWTSAVGRMGAMLAPISFGFLVALKLPLEQNFMAVAIPPIIAAIAVSLIGGHRPVVAGAKLAG